MLEDDLETDWSAVKQVAGAHATVVARQATNDAASKVIPALAEPIVRALSQVAVEAAVSPLASQVQVDAVAANASRLLSQGAASAAQTSRNEAAALAGDATGSVIQRTTVDPGLANTLPRTAVNVLTDVLSPRNWGARVDGLYDDSMRIEAMVADLEPGMRIEWPEGICICAAEMPIVQPGVQMIGRRTRFDQQTYGSSAFQLLADRATISGFDLRQVNPRALLPETVETRFLGEVSRARASAVLITANDCAVRDIHAENWINGVNLMGGERYYQITPEAPTPTTLRLRPQEQRADSYYVGWSVRLLSTTGAASAVVTVAAYDAATNTITAPFAVQLTGTVYYSLIGPACSGNRIRGVRGRDLDFGLLIANYDDLELHDLDIRGIQQTQQTNVRPHAVYGTGNNDHTQAATILRGSRWSAYDCQEGSAFKLRNIKKLSLTDVVAYRSRGVLEIETTSSVSIAQVRGFDIAQPTARPYGVRIVDSADVSISDIRFEVEPTYDNQGIADRRPAAVWLLSSNSGSPLSSSKSVSVENVVGVFRGASETSYLLLTELDQLTSTSLSVDGLTSIRDGYGGALGFARLGGINGGRISRLRHLGGGASPSIMLEASASNVSISYETAGLGIVTVSDSGTGNKLIRDGSLRGIGTPILQGETVVGENTYSTQQMQWSRTGDLVDVRIRMDLTALQSTGNLRVEGLPYTVSSAVAAFRPAGLLDSYSGFTLTAGRIPAAIPAANTKRVNLAFLGNDQQGRLTAAMITATARVDFSLSYRTDEPY